MACELEAQLFQQSMVSSWHSGRRHSPCTCLSPDLLLWLLCFPASIFTSIALTISASNIFLCYNFCWIPIMHLVLVSCRLSLIAKYLLCCKTSLKVARFPVGRGGKKRRPSAMLHSSSSNQSHLQKVLSWQGSNCLCNLQVPIKFSLSSVCMKSFPKYELHEVMYSVFAFMN